MADKKKWLQLLAYRCGQRESFRLQVARTGSEEVLSALERAIAAAEKERDRVSKIVKGERGSEL